MTERGQLERGIETTDMGSDVSTFLRADGIADLDPAFGVITGPQVVAESIARSLMTRRGLMTEEPDRGIDLQDLQSARMSAASLRGLHAVIEREVRADERVVGCSILVEYPEIGVLHVRVEATTRAGPFALVIQSTKAGDLTEVLV